MNLEILDQKIQDIQWKVLSYSKAKAIGSFVAYIDARQVMDILDKACGKANWQDKYEVINGVLFCHIGIKIDNEWIWKSDCGTESDVEKEKGEASDAFKRTAVKWGVGRFLYELPIQWIKTNEPKKDNNYPYPVDENGDKIKDISKYINDKLRIENLRKEPAPEIQKEAKVTTPSKVASTLPKLSDKDKKVIEESIFSISTKALIEVEILKLDISYSLSEEDKEWIESIKKIALVRLEKKEAFFDNLRNKPLSDVYPQIIAVLKSYPDELKKIEGFTNKLFDFVNFKNPNDIEALKVFLCQKEKYLNSNQIFLDKVKATKEELFPTN